jgi:hypothetical protein
MLRRPVFQTKNGRHANMRLTEQFGYHFFTLHHEFSVLLPVFFYPKGCDEFGLVV